MEALMAFEAGNVVILKSGGQPMTVISVDDDHVECIWTGEEGDFFRETIPAIALEAVEFEQDDEDAADEDAENGDDDEEDEDEDEVAHAEKELAPA
jgi:uncharacterized protein YodC (DUF2158 family)